MSKPAGRDWNRLKILARYLVGRERMRQKFQYQKRGKRITVYTDTDFAGCRDTRKSTTGGVAALGQHVIKHWSKTQAVIALSSGEAEYYGTVLGASHGLGLKAILEDMGIVRDLHLRTDASAAQGSANRLGVGKIRHIETNQLWLQQKVREKEISIEKIPGKENWADALTKPVDGTTLEWHRKALACEIGNGRHELMPRADAGNVEQ